MKFSIVVTSDIHGQVERFAQLSKQIASLKPEILIDNGDLTQGSAISYYYQYIKKDTHPLIEQLNALKYDVAVFGNHEFNDPIDVIEEMRQKCHFPWIACNVGDFAQKYIVKDIEGVKVAIIGAVTHFVPLWDEWHKTPIDFEDAFVAIKETVGHVRENEQVDLVIVSYHGGFEKDPKTNRPFCEDDGENQGYKILHEIEGIDVLITGHQHIQIAAEVNGTIVVQPGAHAHSFAKIDFHYENGQFKKEATIMPLEENEGLWKDAEYENWAKTQIAQLEYPATYDDFFEPRLQPHPFVELIHTMQLKLSKAQLSLVELPYHAHGGFTQIVTNEDLHYNFPRLNFLKVIQLSGREMKEAMELSAAVFARNSSGEVDFSGSVYYPELHPYIYDLWGGLDYEINLSKPVGQRIERMYYKGEPIQDADLFEVVINSYRTTGAHGFSMFCKEAIREIRVPIQQLMADFLKGFTSFDEVIKSQFHVKKQ